MRPAGMRHPRPRCRHRRHRGLSHRRTARRRPCRCNRSSQPGTGPMGWVCCPRLRRCRARRRSRPRPCRLGCPIRSSGPLWRRRCPHRSWWSRQSQSIHQRRRRCRRCRRFRPRRSRSARPGRLGARPWRLPLRLRRSQCLRRSVCRLRSRHRLDPLRIRRTRCSRIPRRRRSRKRESSRSWSCSCSSCHRRSWWWWRR